MLARDSRALREYIKDFQPNVDLIFDYDDGVNDIEESVDIPINVNFFWPDV